MCREIQRRTEEGRGEATGSRRRQCRCRRDWRIHPAVGLVVSLIQNTYSRCCDGFIKILYNISVDKSTTLAVGDVIDAIRQLGPGNNPIEPYLHTMYLSTFRKLGNILPSSSSVCLQSVPRVYSVKFYYRPRLVEDF